MHLKLNNELARPIGIVDGTSVGGTRSPRVACRALSDTLVTRADGSTYIIPRRSTKSAARRTTRTTVELSDRAYNYVPNRTAADLAPILAD